MTFYLSFCAFESDIMACAACKVDKRGCKDDCCFAEFFPPQDTAIYKKIKLHFSVIFMRKVLSDSTTTEEYKKQRVQEWKAKANAKGIEKQAGSSSSKTEKKQLQASKCQTSSSNELGCKETCLCAALFPRGAKKTIVEKGKEWVEAEVKPKLEKLWGEIDEELVAQIMLDLENMWEIDEVLAAQIMFDFKNRGDRQ